MKIEFVDKYLAFEDLVSMRERITGAIWEYSNLGQIHSGPVLGWVLTTQIVGFRMYWLKHWSNCDKRWETVCNGPIIFDFRRADVDFIGKLRNGNLTIVMDGPGSYAEKPRILIYVKRPWFKLLKVAIGFQFG